MKPKTLQEFIDEYSGAPYELREFAELAVDLKDAPMLAKAAIDFLNAEAELELRLEANDVEVG